MAAKTKEQPEPLSERLILPVSKAMANEIKVYWHDRQLGSRAEAMRQLLRIGLDVEAKRKR